MSEESIRGQPVEGSLDRKDLRSEEPDLWRWGAIQPADGTTAMRIGEACFQFLFDYSTKIEPKTKEEIILFRLLQKMYSGEESMSVEPDEMATSLRLLQAATLGKQLLLEQRQSVATLASDSELEHLVTILDQIGDTGFIARVNELLGKSSE